MPTPALPRRRKQAPLPWGLKRWLLGGRAGAYFWLGPYHVFADPDAFWAAHREWLLDWHVARGYPVPRRRLTFEVERQFLRRSRERTRASRARLTTRGRDLV